MLEVIKIGLMIRSRAQFLLNNYAGICLTVDLDAYGRRKEILLRGIEQHQDRAQVALSGQMRFSWKDIDRIKSYCDLPIIIKGIATKEDVQLLQLNMVLNNWCFQPWWKTIRLWSWWFECFTRNC